MGAAFGDELVGGGALGEEGGIDPRGRRGVGFKAGGRVGALDLAIQTSEAGIAGFEFGCAGERGARAGDLTLSELSLGLVEENGGLVALELGDGFFREGINRERGLGGLERGEGFGVLATGSLGASGGTLGGGVGQSRLDAGGFSRDEGVGLGFGGGGLRDELTHRQCEGQRERGDEQAEERRGEGLGFHGRKKRLG